MGISLIKETQLHYQKDHRMPLVGVVRAAIFRCDNRMTIIYEVLRVFT